MAILGGQAVGLRNFPSSSYFTSRSTDKAQCPTAALLMTHGRSIASRKIIACSTVQESSPTTTTATPGTEEKIAVPKAAKVKPKAAAKAPVKSLPQLMEEDVIPQLTEILQAHDQLSEIELTFQENRLDGSFIKNKITYTFWAFFPNGDLTGPKGFSLSSYGSEASTVEPFLVDEKKITANLLIFWVEKRLAAQGIIPVWKE